MIINMTIFVVIYRGRLLAAINITSNLATMSLSKICASNSSFQEDFSHDEIVINDVGTVLNEIKEERSS